MATFRNTTSAYLGEVQKLVTSSDGIPISSDLGPDQSVGVSGLSIGEIVCSKYEQMRKAWLLSLVLDAGAGYTAVQGLLSRDWIIPCVQDDGSASDGLMLVTVGGHGFAILGVESEPVRKTEYVIVACFLVMLGPQ